MLITPLKISVLLVPVVKKGLDSTHENYLIPPPSKFGMMGARRKGDRNILRYFTNEKTFNSNKE
jgi:hypothetical protein